MAVREWSPGRSQTRSKRWEVFGGPPFPRTVNRVSGVTAYDGMIPYTDWIAGLGAVGLGYRWPAVEMAVWAQMKRGVTFPLPTELEEEAAADLCHLLRWPEQVRWVKTGSEATAAAMLIARAATRRRRIVSMGYHGWHGAHQPGPELVQVPLGRWDQALRRITTQTAGVLVEATRNTRDDDGSLTLELQGLADRAREVGALFILDEMVTGFRWRVGGIGEYTGVIPDLACFGKALGNGYPIACVVGPTRFMRHAHGVSSTFGGECLGLAAARAVMRVYRTEGVIDRMWRLGERLLAQCHALTGWPVHPVFRGGRGYLTSQRMIPLVQRVAARGHLVHPAGFNIMAAHTEQDVESLADAINSGGYA